MAHPRNGRPDPADPIDAPKSVPSASEGSGASSVASETAELQLLRSLLFKQEIQFVEQLKQKLEDPAARARDVSSVIAEALLLRAGKDDTLARALEPVVENIFKVALRRNPHDFTAVLFPLMGPAIRRSIAEAFRSMLEGFSKSMEMAFSWKGLRWRLEALRTGKPFSEVVLLKTLVYRVEQVFFIHSDTGLVLAHVFGNGVDSQDADMVSAMLTAIQDFVRDCFTGGTQGDLESLQLGEFTIFVEKGAMSYVACVVRGTPPVEFRRRLRTSFELMQVECAEPLSRFNGDTAPFESAKRHLEDCLVSRFVDEDRPLPLWAKALPVLLSAAILCGAGYWGWLRHADKERLAAAAAALQARTARIESSVAALRGMPGLVVVETEEYADKPWSVFCLKDDLAQNPADFLRSKGMDPADLRLTSTPVQSHDPEIVARRAVLELQPPPTVTIDFNRTGTLTLSGTAPMDWILDARRRASLLPGVTAVQSQNLSDPRFELLTALIQSVESTIIHFPLGKDAPAGQDLENLEKAVSDLSHVESLARSMGLGVSLTIYGHADAVGNEKRNYELSQERAKLLAAMLYAKGSHIPIATYGMGADFADKTSDLRTGDQSSRRIELKVHLARTGDSLIKGLKK